MTNKDKTELYDTDAEAALIASVMIAPEKLKDVNIQADDFYNSKNKMIWKAITSLDEADKPIDNITIANCLQSEGKLEDAGGSFYITSFLTNPNTFNATEYARIIKDKSRQRGTLNLANQLAKMSGSEINNDDLDKAIEYLTKLKCNTRVTFATTPQRWTVAELLDTEFPEPNWAIPGLVPEGLTLLGGRPKVGKSWLALQMAHSIGTGGKFFGKDVEKGNVLYIALEDGPRRLQDRIKTYQIPRDALITFERNWPPLHKDGINQLYTEIIQNDYRMIVIDTLTRSFRGLDQNDQPQIDAVMSELQRMCADYHLAILFNDHTTKPKGLVGDPIDDIMNSTVKTAVSDQVLALYKEQGKSTATLKGRGRDTEEIDYTLRWDNDYCCWQLEGETGQIRLTEERQEILDALEELGKSTAPKIAKYLGKDIGNSRRKLYDLRSSQLVKEEKIEGKIYYEKL